MCGIRSWFKLSPESDKYWWRCSPEDWNITRTFTEVCEKQFDLEVWNDVQCYRIGIRTALYTMLLRMGSWKERIGFNFHLDLISIDGDAVQKVWILLFLCRSLWFVFAFLLTPAVDSSTLTSDTATTISWSTINTPLNLLSSLTADFHSASEYCF